jgi:hypothetical protein
MLLQKLVGSLSLALVMSVGTGGAEETSFRSRDTGSYIQEETLIDANGDGKTADLVLMAGQSEQFGQTTTQSVLEWSSRFTQAICPNGKPGLREDLVGGNALTHLADGDLLLIRFDQGTRCVDPTTQAANVSLEGTIVGGAGRLAKAMGNAEAVSITIPELVIDESGVFLSGSIDSEMTGRITTRRPQTGSARR